MVSPNFKFCRGRASMSSILISVVAVAFTFLSSSSLFVNAFDDPDYGVNAYECDQDLNELKNDDRVQRIQGSFIRICFVPDDETKEAGIGIENVLSFVWRTSYGEEDGLDHTHSTLVQESVRNGKGDGTLSNVVCDEDGSVCVLECMLPTKMYIDTGSIYGDGFVTLTNDAGIVPVKRDIFHTADDFFGQKPGQCLSDTTSLMHGNPGLLEATEKYQESELNNGVSGGLASMQLSSSLGYEGRIEEVIVGSTLSISVPKEEQDEYAAQCEDAGGVATYLDDTVVLCPFFNQISTFQMIDGMACLANTTECSDMDTFDVLMDAFAVLGFSNCKRQPVTVAPTVSPTKSSKKPTSKPTNPPTNFPTGEVIINVADSNVNELAEKAKEQMKNSNNQKSSSSSSESKQSSQAHTKHQKSQKAVKGAIVGCVIIILIVLGLLAYKQYARKNALAAAAVIEDGAEKDLHTVAGNTEAESFKDDGSTSSSGGGMAGLTSRLPQIKIPPLGSFFKKSNTTLPKDINDGEDASTNPFVVEDHNNNDNNMSSIDIDAGNDPVDETEGIINAAAKTEIV